MTYGSGTPDDPWILKTPSLTSDSRAWRDETLTPPALVVQVGTTKLSCQLRCIDDLKAMLKRSGDWVAPVLALLGVVELEHEPRNNRVRFRLSK